MNQQGPPTCDVCGTAKTWVPPGTSRTTGMAYEGFWGCPNRKNHPKGQSAGYPQTTFQASQTAQAATGTTNGPAMTRDATGRSIEAQAACKAACEAFQGAGLADQTPNIQQEWIVATAQGMLSRVIEPYVQGKDFADGDINF